MLALFSSMGYTVDIAVIPFCRIDERFKSKGKSGDGEKAGGFRNIPVPITRFQEVL